MADAWGVESSYVDAGGETRRVDDEIVETLRAVIGDPRADSSTGPIVVRRGSGARLGAGVLHLEDGGSLTIDDAPLAADVPLGYHRFEHEGGEHMVIVSPATCVVPSEPMWGWAMQLYAARSRRSWGIGDLGDLADWARRSRESLGAGFTMVNPLHAAAPVAPMQPSPYSPTTRCFVNPIYLRVADVPGAEGVDEFASAFDDANWSDPLRLVDRDAVWAAKRRALEAVWAATRERADDGFERWRARQPSSLRTFATWCVLAERHGADWRRWPRELRHPDGVAVARAARDFVDRVRFHEWLQWCCAQQIDRASAETTLIQDLPIGFDPGGADAWRWQDLLADGVSVGAPPDEFNRRGQDWGLPPFVPHRLIAADYGPFVETIRATMPHGGGLRVDHVMGLFRLWWIPPGCSPDSGAYVRYPADDLLAIVALESHRAGALVVGEDLGTVEEGVRDVMADHRMLSYRLLWFEDRPPAQWPAMSMGAVTTHDLPTIAGLWRGDDLEAQRRAGLDPNEESTTAIIERLSAAIGDAADGDQAEVTVALHSWLAASPSLLLAATLDDVTLAERRPNMPGAGDAHPNWSIPLPKLLDGLEQDGTVRAVAAALDREKISARDVENRRSTPSPG